jgi:hypothetical protein
MNSITWSSHGFTSRLAAACPAAFYRTIFVRLRTAAAFTPVSPQHAIDDSGSTADSGLNPKSSHRTVFATGAAFHAGITINNHCGFPVHFKYIVRADIQAHAAAGAF